MSIEELIQAVHIKLDNGDYNLTDVDIDVIFMDKGLTKRLVSLIADGALSLSDRRLEKVTRAGVLDQFASGEIPTEVVDKFVLVMLQDNINKGKCYPGMLNELATNITISAECYKKGEEMINAFFANPESKINDNSITEELVVSLLDRKCYDMILKMHISNNDAELFSEGLYQRLKAELPYDKKPQIITIYEKIHEIYTYTGEETIEELLEDLKLDVWDQTKVKNALINKIREADDLSIYNGNTDFKSFVDSYVAVLSVENQKEFLMMLFDKNYILSMEQMLDDGIIQNEDVRAKVKHMSLNRLRISDDGVIIARSRLYDAFTDDDSIENLIRYGDINNLVNAELFRYELHPEVAGKDRVLEKYIPLIVEQIRNDNPYYEEIIKGNGCNLVYYPEIIEALLEKGKLEYIDLNSLFMDEENYNIYFDKIFNYLKNKPDVVLQCLRIPREISTKFIKACMDNGMYDVVFLNHMIDVRFFKENQAYVLEKMNDLSFANHIANYALDEVFQIPSIVEKLIKTPLCLQRTAEFLIRNEDVKCTHELYILVREYCAKEYQLNLEHFDRMEQTLGPNIIKYVKNERLKEIINLDEESFNKVVGLFPPVEYSMKDIEGGYESLMQRLYGQRKPEDKELFHLLDVALNDRDMETVTRLKEKIIMAFKPEYLEPLLQKYNLENISSIEHLLDLIIEKYYTTEKDQYLAILSDITNQYVVDSRETFVREHYFDSLHPEYDIKYDFLDAITRKDVDVIDELSQEVIESLDDKFLERLCLKYKLPEELKDRNTLFEYLVAKLQDPSARNKFLPIYSEIIDYYRASKMKEHASELGIGNELGLQYTLDERSSNNAYIDYVLRNIDEFHTEDRQPVKDKIIETALEMGVSREVIDACFDFYAKGGDPKNANFDLKQLGLLKAAARLYLRNNPVYNKIGLGEREIISLLNHLGLIKRNYYVESTFDPYQILVNLDIKLLKNGLFTDEELYQKLVEIMKKKKLHALPDNYKETLQECKISDDYGNIAAFINYFGPIYQKEVETLIQAKRTPEQASKEALRGIVQILSSAEAFSSHLSSLYAQVLGQEDSKLIALNPSRNAAVFKTGKLERLEEAISLTKENFERKGVTIPTFDEVVEFESKEEPKKLEVIVGNFTDPTNLTHGERTGACMRIGGAGEELFYFCLHNPNGFHIRFEDPETHEYISRVSGFRNGNTVFLNGLRESCNPDKYSNEDLYKALKVAAERLIELSKNSPCPIENVVILPVEALEDRKSEAVHLGIEDCDEGLEDLRYKNIKNMAIVVATTAKQGSYVPIDFDKSKVPTYETCRARVHKTTDIEEAKERINRVVAIKQLFNGVDTVEIAALKFEKGFKEGIVTDDWYIYVDEDEIIHFDYIDKDPRALDELKQHLAEMQMKYGKPTEQDMVERGEGFGTR